MQVFQNEYIDSGKMGNINRLRKNGPQETGWTKWKKMNTLRSSI